MIEAFLGLPGMGKTYLMTRQGLRFLRKGREVWANYYIEGAHHFSQLSEVYDVRNAVILLDEAGLVAPASMWGKIPFEVMAHWREHRHHGVELYYTAQDLQDVATPLRRVTQFCNWVHRWGTPSRPLLITWKTTDAKGKTKYGGGFHLFDKDVANQYDTHFDVVKQSYLESGKGADKGKSVDVQG